MPARVASRLAAIGLGPTFARYFGASLLSLGVDVGLFLLLHAAGFPAIAASVVSYGAGLAAHWFLSTRFVFDNGMVASGVERTRQKAMFVATGLIGLCITALIVGAGDWLGIDPRLAKAVAVVVSFQATYLARRAGLFRA